MTPTFVIAQSHERPDLEACLPQFGLSTIESIGEYRLGGIYCAYAVASYVDYSTAAIFEFKTSEDAKTAFWNEFHANNTYSLTSVQGYESAAVGEEESIAYVNMGFQCLGVSGKYVVITGYVRAGGATEAITSLTFVNIPQNIPLILIVGIICLIIVAVIVLIWIRRR
jgi:hypothetical protein